MDLGQKNITRILSVFLLAGAIIASAGIIRTERSIRQLKVDLSELNHIRYNLLDVEQWTMQIEAIMEKKIDEFEITPENEAKLRASVEVILHRLIDAVDLIIRERTSGQFSGLKRWIADMAVDVDQLRDSVPSFSNEVMAELEKDETKRMAQDFLLQKLDSYVESTRNAEQLRKRHDLYRKYGSTSTEQCNIIINQKIATLSRKSATRAIWLIALIILVWLVNLVRKRTMDNYQAVVLVFASAILLIDGVTIPMIQLEAKIETIRFFLMGEEMRFSDNILYFQNKSILDVVAVLVREGGPDVIFVGILIFTFSIIFPTLKLLSSLLIRFSGQKLKTNRLVRFFALKSGKWSMADVMVVALFMAYIGFNGIINNQLSGLTENPGSAEVITTNGTQLLLGFYLFLAFCISSLVLSEILVRRTPDL
ncbi:MAG: paraquat-inducible protein A [Bacteroidales bacterium]